MSVDPEIFAIFQHKVERIPHFARVTEVRHIYIMYFRVHGINGLRIVDASVMPEITSGNTNAPTMMIAEKVSDIILGKEPLKPIKNL